MTVREMLIAAKKLIADKDHWCQDAAARDSKDRSVTIWDPNAAKFCALGALVKAGDPNWGQARRQLEAFTDGVGVTTINDGQGHEAVMALYEKAINDLPA